MGPSFFCGRLFLKETNDKCGDIAAAGSGPGTGIPGMWLAKDGQPQAHMDVLAAIPGMPVLGLPTPELAGFRQ